VCSKSFKSQETLLNALSARNWFVETSKQQDISKNFVGVSSSVKEAERFGITTNFEIWDFVGGRYSIWSAMGLSIAISIGMDKFFEFLDGAYEIDEYFKRSDIRKNIPVVMGLLGFW
jgi:glucose-6-phosphate isomerase